MTDHLPITLSTLAAAILAFTTPAAAEPGTVDLKLLCFPKTAAVSEIEMLVGTEEVRKVKLQAHEFTLPLKVPRLPVWRFGKSTVDSEGNFSFTTYAKVNSIASKRQLLLLIRKGPENEDGFRITALNPKTLRGKNYLVTNLTRGAIAGTVGGRNFRLSPGENATLKPNADRGKNLCFASLSYLRNGQPRAFFSSNWKLREQSRALIFVYNAPGQKSPRIHSVIDPVRPAADPGRR